MYSLSVAESKVRSGIAPGQEDDLEVDEEDDGEREHRALEPSGSERRRVGMRVHDKLRGVPALARSRESKL